MATSSRLGASIRAAYRLSGLNRAQFQRAVGVAYSTVLSWERGVTRPNAEHLERIAEVTGCSLSDLVQGPKGNGVDSRERQVRYAAYDRFLQLDGLKLTSSERKTLESIIFAGVEPTPATFVAILCGLRMGRLATDPARGRARRKRPG